MNRDTPKGSGYLESGLPKATPPKVADFSPGFFAKQKRLFETAAIPDYATLANGLFDYYDNLPF